MRKFISHAILISRSLIIRQLSNHLMHFQMKFICQISFLTFLRLDHILYQLLSLIFSIFISWFWLPIVRYYLPIITGRTVIPQTLIISIPSLNLFWFAKSITIAHLILVKILLDDQLLFGNQVEALKFFLCNCLPVVIIIGFCLDDLLLSVW